MILADTSAWIEYLRETGSHVASRHRELGSRQSLAVTDVVIMEVMAGARTGTHHAVLRRALARAVYVPAIAPDDYEAAADLYRACRRGGVTPRHLTDCLVAAVAIREDLPVLHADRDFDLIAEHTPLRIDEPNHV